MALCMMASMGSKLRVAYLQLPVIDFGYDYRDADHPLAGGYLAAYALARGVKHEPIFLSRKITSFGSDPVIVDHLLSLRPDVIACTLSLWNLERTISIVEEVKRARPEIIALAGGPEAAPGFEERNPRHPFDWVCDAGEGEAAFATMLRIISAQRKIRPEDAIRACNAALTELEALPSPYLEDILPLAPDRSLWIETMRGCPFRCGFCFYGKSQARLRRFSPDWLRRHLAWARKKRATEIYLLDPSFQILPGLEARLEDIARFNRGIPLHTEAGVEKIDARLATAFARAGFRSLETGLQSIHPEVLRQVNRRTNPESFAHGGRLLKERGIELWVDIILGLPGDTPRGFLETVDFLVKNDLAAETNVYPLLLLPGTSLRQQATGLGVRFQRQPPYQVEATPGFSIASFRETVARAEDRLGQDIYPLHLPDLSQAPKGNGLVGTVEVDLDKWPQVGLSDGQIARLSQCPVFLFQSSDRAPWDKVRAWGRWQKKALPRLMPFWGVRAEQPFSLRELQGALAELHDADSYQARLYALAPDAYLRLSCRPFILSTCAGNADFWLEANEMLPVIRMTRTTPLVEATGPLSRLPVFWKTSRPVTQDTLATLAALFRGREAELLFSSCENQRRWARLCDLPEPATPLRRIRLPDR